jgi:hypothetical protein
LSLPQACGLNPEQVRDGPAVYLIQQRHHVTAVSTPQPQSRNGI